MVQVVKFPAGSRCLCNLTPDIEVSRDPDLVQIENLQCQKGQ